MYEQDDTFSSSSQKTSDLALILGGAFLLFGMVFLVIQDIGYDQSPIYINRYVLEEVMSNLDSTHTNAAMIREIENYDYTFIRFYALKSPTERKEFSVVDNEEVFSSLNRAGRYFHSKDSYLIYDNPQNIYSKSGILMFFDDPTKSDTLVVRILEYNSDANRGNRFVKTNIRETNGVDNENYDILNDILMNLL